MQTLTVSARHHSVSPEFLKVRKKEPGTGFEKKGLWTQVLPCPWRDIFSQLLKLKMAKKTSGHSHDC